MATATQKELKALKDDISEIKEFIADKAEDAASRNNVHHMFDTKDLKVMARKTGRDVRHFLRDRHAQAQEAADNVESTIKENPFKSAAAAFAAGAVVTALMRKS